MATASGNPASDIHCIEGEDAILTCKLRPDIPPVKWLKNDKEIIQNEKCIMSTVDTQYKLTLKNTTARDSGEYHVHVGIFSKKVQLNITDDFLEDPYDIECIEGEDAFFACKVWPKSPSVKWFKDGNELKPSVNCIMSIVDTHYELKLRNTKLRDSGKCCVQVGKFSRKMHLKIIEIPKEMSADERNTYMDAIKSGDEVRQYVRIQVIGKDRVGKTSLVHRLLFLDEGKYDGKSTDGIDINRNCQIRTSDGEWIVGEVDTEKEIIKRILQAANIKQRGTDPVSGLSLPLPADEKQYETEQMHNGQEPIQTKGQKIGTKTFSEHDEVPELKDETLYASNTSAVSSTNLEENKLNMRENVDKRKNQDTSFALSAKHQQLFSDKNDHITETMMEKMNEIILNARAKKEKMTSEGLVECGIWDFAGQKDYYATHQTFFTPHAIYLLVADINEEIKAIKHDEELDFDSVGDYIDFWLDSIHCFCKDVSAVKLCPPVILVCTGTDKVEKGVDWKSKYNEKFHKIFGGQRKADHRRGIYFISNTFFFEEDVKEIQRLRKHISETAKEMAYFAEKLPTRWIQLENALGVLKSANEHVFLFKNMKKIAQQNLIEEDELLLFLNYQHKIGNLIFFKEVREYIILQPEWLVKCYRCLVCDCHPEKRNFNMICPTAWHQLISTGELSNTLINQLFEKEPELKFEDHQDHLLKVMEKCDIIVKPQFTDSSNNECQTPDLYYLPCMIEKSASYKSIKETFISNSSSVSITPWLVLEFEFLPLAYFNHILFHYIRNFEVCKMTSESPAIYREKSVFYIDKLRKFIICFSHNAISLQIWEWDDVRDSLYQNMLNQLCENIERTKKKLGQDLNYRIKAKCDSGNFSKSDGRISFKDLNERDIYMCEEHNCTHSKAKIENTWLKHADNREKREKEKKETEVMSKRLLDEWQEETDTFVETRAAKYVLKCIQNNSVVAITASSGVGKTSTLRYVALKMSDEGYNVLPVTNPNDIVKLHNINQKTLFVIDDFCGNYFINQSDLYNWNRFIEQIKVMIQNKLTKVIVACRLQVYQDEQFESLSIFRTNECNLLSEKLCLSTMEKQSIAELYLGTKALEIIQYRDLHDFFPLLCKLCYTTLLVDITQYFRTPYSVYKVIIDQLDAEQCPEICALLLCVMFNNRMKETWLTEEIDTEKRKIIQNTLEVCGLDKGTSRLTLIDAFDFLLGMFLKKEKGVYKTVHDTVFDFLAFYFGHTYAFYLIKHAVSGVIMQRFVLNEFDGMTKFITVLPHQYHDLFMGRMIQDWFQRKVHCVFHNINMKVRMFRQKLLTFLANLDNTSQRQLAHTFDINNNETVLSLCSYIGDITLVQWCLGHGVDVNHCDSFGMSPLYISARKGHKEIVRLFLQYNADLNKCVDDGTSPLFVSCQNNHKRIVRLLLEQGADYKKCNKMGISAKEIASKNGHNDIVTIINEHLRKVEYPEN